MEAISCFFSTSSASQGDLHQVAHGNALAAHSSPSLWNRPPEKRAGRKRKLPLPCPPSLHHLPLPCPPSLCHLLLSGSCVSDALTTPRQPLENCQPNPVSWLGSVTASSEENGRGPGTPSRPHLDPLELGGYR